MLRGTMDGLGEGIAINEELQSDGSAALELTEVEILDNKQYLSEVDEIRINETAETMAQVFSEDVLANWSEMSLDERSAKLNEYYIRAGESLGIETKGVIMESMDCEQPGIISFGYNSGDGYIHLNESVVDDPAQLGQVLTTATHEMRHQFQNDALISPENFSDIPQSVLDTWKYEMNPCNYINPDYDYQGYYEQAIECDARFFSEDVVKSYMDKMNLN